MNLTTTQDDVTRAEMRDECYIARRAIRSGHADKWLRDWERKLRTPIPERVARVHRLAQVLPPLLSQHCVAEAETRAIEQVIKEWDK